MTELTLKTRVMLGVYTLFIIRRLRSPFIGELFVLGILCASLSFLVSMPHVIENIMITRGSYSFFVDAFTKTQMTVKLLVLSAAVSCGFFVRNITVFTTNLVKERFA
jgi:uncharacterized membrane protein YkgB